MHSIGWFSLIYDDIQIHDNSRSLYSQYGVLVLVRIPCVFRFWIPNSFHSIPDLSDSGSLCCIFILFLSSARRSPYWCFDLWRCSGMKCCWNIAAFSSAFVCSLRLCLLPNSVVMVCSACVWAMYISEKMMETLLVMNIQPNSWMTAGDVNIGAVMALMMDDNRAPSNVYVSSIKTADVWGSAISGSRIEIDFGQNEKLVEL